MKRLALLVLVVAAGVPVRADDPDPKNQAQDILNKGSALFDARDAAAMAATYTEDAQLLWLDRDNSTGEFRTNTKKDRAEIEALYRDLYKDAKEKTTSKNTVEHAKLLTPELMVIHGEFQPDTSKDGKFSFVQVRIKSGDKWLIKTLQIFVVSPN
jgi:hypothetical protein